MPTDLQKKLVDEWLNRLYGLGNSQNVFDAYELTAFCMDCARHGNLSPIDQLMAEVDVTKISPTFMVTLLRSNFRLHHHMVNWVDFRDRVHVELTSRGLQANSILRGLLDIGKATPSGALDDLLGVHPSLR